MWGWSCCSKTPNRDLVAMCKSALEQRIKAAWIWLMVVHLRVRLFFWKVAWDWLSIRTLLRDRDMDLLVAYPMYGSEDEMTKHALLRCPWACLIWRMAGGQPWGAMSDAWLSPFLEKICRCTTKGHTIGCRMAYIAYQIWLSRNTWVFDVEVVPMYWMLDRACFLAKEYY